MKLVHLNIETQFVNCGKINILTVENGKAFREFCGAMKSQTEGELGLFVLSDGEEILPLSKCGIYVSDYFSLDLSDKKLVTKLYAAICSDSDSKFPIETADAISSFCSLLDKLNSESEIAIEYDESAPLTAILKAFSVKPQTVYGSFLEKLISFVDAIINLTSTKFFCFVNLKANLSNNEIEQLYNYFHNADLFVLSIESSVREKRDDEFNVLIDNDLCEIIC